MSNDGNRMSKLRSIGVAVWVFDEAASKTP